MLKQSAGLNKSCNYRRIKYTEAASVLKVTRDKSRAALTSDLV